MLDPLFDVLNRDEALELKAVVDDQQLFNPVLMQNLASLVQGRAFRGGDQVFSRHDLRNFQIHPIFKTKVPVRDDPDEFALLSHRNPRNTVLGHDLMCVSDGMVRRNRHRIQNHAAL